MKPAFIEKSASFALPDANSARIAVVADTHSTPHPGLLDHLTALTPAAILHAGDIGDRAVLEQLEHIAPTFAVRGNIDPRTNELPDLLLLELTGLAEPLRIALTHVALYGPKLRADMARRAHAHQASLVVCGHSHVPFIGMDRKLTLFNPGSAGPRRFHLPILFGTIEFTTRGLRLAHFECATGAAWSPP